MREKTEQKILRKRDVTAGQLLGKIEDEDPLEDGEDIRESFGFRSHLRVISEGCHKVKGVYLKGLEATVNPLFSAQRGAALALAVHKPIGFPHAARSVALRLHPPRSHRRGTRRVRRALHRP